MIHIVSSMHFCLIHTSMMLHHSTQTQQLGNNKIPIMCIIYVILLFEVSNCEIITNTAQGALRGVSQDGYVSYVNIPYATINDTANRFKAAGLAPTWKGVRQLYRERAPCSATSPEDCLRLDVHVPFGSTLKPWPVLVWIQSGSGQYHPKTLVKKGLLVVIVNYRYGPFGFLCLNNEKLSGNVGLKDLVLALKWVRDNIPAFRGNPSKVIIAGQSFGAALVDALLISTMSKGLFHGAILQSGSILCPWAFNYDADVRAKAFVSSFTKSEDLDDITNTLTKAKASDLIEKTKKLNFPYFPFGICIEKSVKNEKAFLSEAPKKLLKTMTSDIPIMMGYNTDEAYIFAAYLKRMKVLKKLRKDVQFLLPEELLFRNEKEVRQVAAQIKEAYFSRNVTMRAVLAYHRDAYYINHIYRSVRLHSETNRPVYFYQFSHASDLGVDEEDNLKKTGAAHSDELVYLFPEDGHELTGDDKLVQDRIVNLWSNFVKFLNPTPSAAETVTTVTWEAVRQRNLRVLDINANIAMKDFPYSTTMRLWDDIYEKYYYRRHN